MAKPRSKVYAVITAGGSGSRFFKTSGTKTPKQFLNLNGKPVILYSMQAFQKCREIDDIIISADKKYFDMIHAIASKNRITKLKGLVEGGKTRFHSVKNAVLSIDNPPQSSIIVIHDAARPNISIELVKKMLGENGEVISGCRVTETIKREKKGFITETLNRENLWIVQTPQVFRHSVLKHSYKKCGRKNGFTDEAALAEYCGYKVKIIEGSRSNIKITAAEDLLTLKKLMK